LRERLSADRQDGARIDSWRGAWRWYSSTEHRDQLLILTLLLFLALELGADGRGYFKGIRDTNVRSLWRTSSSRSITSWKASSCSAAGGASEVLGLATARSAGDHRNNASCDDAASQRTRCLLGRQLGEIWRYERLEAAMDLELGW